MSAVNWRILFSEILPFISLLLTGCGRKSIADEVRNETLHLIPLASDTMGSEWTWKLLTWHIIWRFWYDAFVKVREVIRLLEADGWRLVVTEGSHRQYRHLTNRAA
jgi:HicA toxin of bacterial toxin-antitoxin,